MTKKSLLNRREPAKFKQPDSPFQSQTLFMHSNPNRQTTNLVCWFIAVMWAACLSVSKADDAATATTSIAANNTVAASPPETTNTPVPAVVPEATNAPTVASALANTNSPLAATGPTATNMPPAGAAPPTSNTPSTATAPASTPPPAATQPAATVPLVSTTRAKTFEETTAPSYQPFTLGAEAGTTGVGGGAVWRFADNFGLVGGMDYLKFSLNRTYSGVPYSGNVDLQSEYAGINYYPSKGSSFHISLGAIFNQNQFTGSAVSATDGAITVNGYPVPANTSVNLEYKQQPVDPYVSIGGNLYLDKRHHLSLGGELGAFYLGNPKVSVSTNPSGVVPQSDLAAYQQQVENDIKKVPVWPVLKLSLNYSF
jgi:hypothetical protein